VFTNILIVITIVNRVIISITVVITILQLLHRIISAISV